MSAMSPILWPMPGSLFDVTAHKPSRHRFSRSLRGVVSTNTRGGIRRLCRPRLECLESRLAPAVHDALATALPIVPLAAAGGVIHGAYQAGTTEYFRFSATS